MHEPGRVSPGTKSSAWFWFVCLLLLGLAPRLWLGRPAPAQCILVCSRDPAVHIERVGRDKIPPT